MMGLPLLIWTAFSGLAGLWFLFRAATIRWRPEQAGWRMALFAAGFGLVGLSVPSSADSLLRAIPPVIAAAAMLFIGLSALRTVRRR